MHKAEPISVLVLSKALPKSVLFWPEGLLPCDAEIAEKTSGAPLPTASKETPANDSESLNFNVIYSRVGDK